ncbi:MAG: beta-ketoacyl-ACP synthase II [Lachnospirales bacterium]
MNRVVVTGYGVVSAVGNNVNDFWENVKKGTCGIDEIKSIDVSEYDVKLAGEIKDFDPKYVDRKEKKRLAEFCQYALEASGEAVTMSGIDLEKIDQDEFGVFIGSGIGGLDVIEENHKKLLEIGPNKVEVLTIPKCISNMASGYVAIKYGAKGTAIASVTACASGTNSIGEAYRSIKHGYHKYILAGGTENVLTNVGIVGFSNLKAISKSDDKNRASIPFDKERNGFVMGDGAGVMFLEEMEHAVQRGANILGEVVGYGSTCDAYHMTSPDPEGIGPMKAMEKAIKEAGIQKEEVGYVNAHGTSTPLNDKIETLAIKKVFGEHAYDLNISSSKSMFGHCLGAAGGIEGILTLLSLKEGVVTPTINLKVRDDELDLNYTPELVEKDIKYALSNSLGFGGHNAVICLKKWEGK